MPSSLLFAAAALIWGSTYYAITLQLAEVTPIVSVVYRFSLASAVLFAVCVLQKKRLLPPWRVLKWTMLSGLFHFALSYSCTYASEQYVVSALVAVLFALMVFWNMLANRIVFGTPITRRMLGAASVAVAGMAMLFYHSIAASWGDLLAGGSGHFLLGLVLALLATLSSAAGNAAVVKLREQSTDTVLTTAWSMCWGALLVLIYALVSGQQFRVPDTPIYWASLLHLSLMGSVVAFLAYFTLIGRIGSQKTVYISVCTPVISVLLSVKLEHYLPGPLEWIGMVLCLSSVAWAVRSPAPAAIPVARTIPEPETT